MLSLKLAIKNLIGAGLRTWLNVIALSFSYIFIIFYNGMIDGWQYQAINDTTDWEIAGGQLWQENYDPYDAFTLVDAHAPIPDEISAEVKAEKMTPILVRQAAIFPNGRMQSILIKGIDPKQQILQLPTHKLKAGPDEVPVIIGKVAAQNAGLAEGDRVMVRWRDTNGMFDARDFTISHIFDTDVPGVDRGQFWIPLDILQKLTDMPNEATLLVSAQGHNPAQAKGWDFKTQDFLLTDLKASIAAERFSGTVLYILLLIIALLAIFDTQVLSIFRRQKEIGTYIALGMTRKQVVGLFTVEGAANSLLAAVFSAVWGIPLLWWVASVGIPMSSAEISRDAGISVSDRIIPVYGLAMISTTILLVVISSTIVSYLPSRKIAFMKPTDALKGKLQ